MEFMRTYTVGSSELTLLFSGVLFCHLLSSQARRKKRRFFLNCTKSFEVSAAQISGIANLVYLRQTGFGVRAASTWLLGQGLKV